MAPVEAGAIRPDFRTNSGLTKDCHENMKRILLIIMMLAAPYVTSYITALIAISWTTKYVDSSYSIATGFVLFCATPLVALIGSMYSYFTRTKQNHTYKSLAGYFAATIILSFLSCIYILSIDLYPGQPD